ncbi:MAG: hypothetical protein ACLUCA_12365, partial [Mediterraneibacter gnavus]
FRRRRNSRWTRRNWSGASTSFSSLIFDVIASKLKLTHLYKWREINRIQEWRLYQKTVLFAGIKLKTDKTK